MEFEGLRTSARWASWQASPERHHGTRGTELPVEARAAPRCSGSPHPLLARCRALHAALPDRLRHPGRTRRQREDRMHCTRSATRRECSRSLRDSPASRRKDRRRHRSPVPGPRSYSIFDDMGCELNRGGCILASQRSSITFSAGSGAIAPPAGWEANVILQVPSAVDVFREARDLPATRASGCQRTSAVRPRYAQAAWDGLRGDARPARAPRGASPRGVGGPDPRMRAQR